MEETDLGHRMHKRHNSEKRLKCADSIYFRRPFVIFVPLVAMSEKLRVNSQNAQKTQ